MPKFIMIEPREPFLHPEPIKPLEFKMVEYNIVHKLDYNKEYSISEIEPFLPQGYSFRDISIRKTKTNNFCCDCGNPDEFVDIYYLRREPNRTFKSELKAYNKGMVLWKKEKEEWDKLIPEFIEDVKAYLKWAKKEKVSIDKEKYKALRKKYNFK